MPQGSAPIPALISSGVFLSVLMFQTRCKSLTACQIGRATLASRVQPNQNGGGGGRWRFGGMCQTPWGASPRRSSWDEPDLEFLQPPSSWKRSQCLTASQTVGGL